MTSVLACFSYNHLSSLLFSPTSALSLDSAKISRSPCSLLAVSAAKCYSLSACLQPHLHFDSWKNSGAKNTNSWKISLLSCQVWPRESIRYHIEGSNCHSKQVVTNKCVHLNIVYSTSVLATPSRTASIRKHESHRWKRHIL